MRTRAGFYTSNTYFIPKYLKNKLINDNLLVNESSAYKLDIEYAETPAIKYTPDLSLGEATTPQSPTEEQETSSEGCMPVLTSKDQYDIPIHLPDVAIYTDKVDNLSNKYASVKNIDETLPVCLPYGANIITDPYEFAIKAGLLKKVRGGYMPQYAGQIRSIQSFLVAWNDAMIKYRTKYNAYAPALPTPRDLSRKIIVPPRKKKSGSKNAGTKRFVSEDGVRQYLKNAGIPVSKQ
ncbi:MAG: hypothetical protein IAA97_01160 [Spirochaetes bacterium]|uniref:Uncharacterized protein n=1 Tax=Candidatus Ornithospirochaeta stercoripullorum TaxID=2840899 RepID=A0A9D9H1L7_9SPIO|nr:hypothetical protein [Candidatus Ornithospirochaeta stercoripullorum]